MKKLKKIFKTSSEFAYLIENALENIGDLVSIIDIDGNILYTNKVLKAILEENIEGTNCTDGVNNSFVCDISLPLMKKTKQVLKREIELKGKQYRVKSSPVLDDNKNIIAIIEIYHDISDEREIYGKLIEKMKDIRKDILAAEKVQRALLPKVRDFLYVDFEYRYEPSLDLSGDIFDYYVVDKDRLVVYIADVVGKGVSASMITLFVKEAVRNITMDTKGSAEALEELRRMFSLLNLEQDKYLTIFLGIYDIRDKSFTYTNAGHNSPPIYIHKGEVSEIYAAGLPISPVFEQVKYQEQKIYLESDDELIFYTDGIIEAKNDLGEQFGEDNLIDIVKSYSRKSDKVNILDVIVDRVKHFCWRNIEDDIALVQMKIK